MLGSFDLSFTVSASLPRPDILFYHTCNLINLVMWFSLKLSFLLLPIYACCHRTDCNIQQERNTNVACKPNYNPHNALRPATRDWPEERSLQLTSGNTLFGTETPQLGSITCASRTTEKKQTPPPITRTRSYIWCFDNSLLTDMEIALKLREHLSQYFAENTSEESSPATIWVAHKCVIRG